MNINLSTQSVKKAIFLISFCLVLVTNSYSEILKNNSQDFFFPPSGVNCKDPLLILKLVQVDSKKLLQISFNGNEGVDAEVKILDDRKNIAATFNLELIKTPYYATVDVTNLPPGKYSIELSTKIGLHTSTLLIK